MTNTDDLVKRLREAARTGKPDGWTMLAVSEWNDAANVIESLQRELEQARKEVKKWRSDAMYRESLLKKTDAALAGLVDLIHEK
jgi:hypothetical protein